MTFHMGKTAWRVHPLLPVLWAFSLLTGAQEKMLAMLLAMALHESGHLLAAKLARQTISSVEITPFGGVICADGMKSASGGEAFAIAAAGPLFSLLGCFAAPLLYRAGFLSFSFTAGFIRAGLLLLTVNLFPALPLDGGQMARSVLNRFFPRPAVTRVLTAASVGAGLGLIGLTLYFSCQGQIVFAPAFAGIYLMYTAAQEGRRSAARYVTALIGRRQRLEKGEALPVQLMAARADVPVRALLGQLSPGKYHVIFVLMPDGLSSIGTVEEKALCDAVLETGEITLGECAQKTGQALCLPR